MDAFKGEGAKRMLFADLARRKTAKHQEQEYKEVSTQTCPKDSSYKCTQGAGARDWTGQSFRLCKSDFHSPAFAKMTTSTPAFGVLTWKLVTEPDASQFHSRGKSLQIHVHCGHGRSFHPHLSLLQPEPFLSKAPSSAHPAPKLHLGLGCVSPSLGESPFPSISALHSSAPPQ